ncbi:MAG: formylglycine-generating enzyme family protein [Gammaproteobacteria bacterium]|nr:formylglycine-generating enzyme family protein [Gammaproteobacteria bacterium]
MSDSVMLRGMGAAGVFVLVLGCAQEPLPGPKARSESAMQLVQGATFRMGTDEHELESIRDVVGLRSIAPLMSEVPSREFTVADFYMDTFSVSNAGYFQFVTANPGWSRGQLDKDSHNGRYLEHWQGGEPPQELLMHPVTFITWHSAVAYCEWRGKRLPTEAEYEWAAQDGKTRAEFPWGDAPPSDELVSWGKNGIDRTVPVGSYPPNARNLFDMSGNVWHFTADPWLGSYAEMSDSSVDIERAMADPGIRRVVRGGSWGANAANLRVRYRDSHRPFDAREMVGFRCAKSTGINGAGSKQQPIVQVETTHSKAEGR